MAKMKKPTWAQIDRLVSASMNFQHDVADLIREYDADEMLDDHRYQKNNVELTEALLPLRVGSG